MAQLHQHERTSYRSIDIDVLESQSPSLDSNMSARSSGPRPTSSRMASSFSALDEVDVNNNEVDVNNDEVDVNNNEVDVNNDGVDVNNDEVDVNNDEVDVKNDN
eukprot:GHVP01038776.1.p3 GENE.GHVP01038776.1~~GHVP01038776.1.p3  ORF type:complete len:104 (-),score=19.71 GHVP01038776.1:696-1007(-)